MSNSQINAIFGMVQRMGASIQAIEDKLNEGAGASGCPQEAAASNQSQEALNELRTEMKDSLKQMARAIGLLHIKISPDDPLPDSLLEHTVMRDFVENYPLHAAQPFNPPGREAQIRHFANMTMAELVAFQAVVKEVLENPADTNRRRFNARHYDQPLTEEIRKRQREEERDQQRDRGPGR